jgi:hypothetical protein
LVRRLRRRERGAGETAGGSPARDVHDRRLSRPAHLLLAAGSVARAVPGGRAVEDGLCVTAFVNSENLGTPDAR